MKFLKELLESEEVTPEVKWRTNGDKSYTVRIDYGNDRVFVHTNKNLKVLQDLVKERYGTKKFVK